jgi:hypothetical protein
MAMIKIQGKTKLEGKTIFDTGIPGLAPDSISNLELWLDGTTGFYDATTGGNVITANNTSIARWEDQSSNSNHATQSTVNDQPLYQSAVGSASFDNVSDSLNCGQPSSLDITGNGSIVFWCYMNSLGGFDGFVSKAIANTGSIPNDSQYHVEIFQDKLRTIITGNDLRNGTTTTGTAATVSTGVWQQFAFTWDGSNLTQYKNGSFAASKAQSGNPQSKSADVLIGRRARAYGAIDGEIGEVQIYSKALTSTEIGGLYTRTALKY